MSSLVKCAMVHLWLHVGAMRITINEGQLSSSFLGKSDAIRAAAAELAAYVKSLGPHEPHHVCVTGNEADAVVDNFILQGSSEFRHHLALTSGIDSTTCSVEEAKMGNTLFTISRELPNRCIDDWKTHARTCDVLLHAQSGSNCEQLVGFRKTNNNCAADMIVVYDNEELHSCYEDKNHASCEDEGEWLFAKAEDIAQGTPKAVKRALSKNVDALRKKFFKGQQTKAGVTSTLEPTLDELRTNFQLTHDADGYTSIEDELAKITSGDWLRSFAQLGKNSESRDR